MNFVFAIYANDIYCELHLPALDNADYTMVLRASERGLLGDVQVQLDVMNQRWRSKPSTDYQLFCKGRMFEGEQLEHGQILQLITKEKMTPRQLTIVSVALGVGYGMGANSGILANTPHAFQLICGESGIVPAAFVAILLNVLLPKNDQAE